jgi:Ca2+-binding EF-hand superfamily protein
LFDEIDADADEKLSVDEIIASEAKFNRYVATTDASVAAAGLSTKERARRIDADKDGLVSRSEHADAAALKFKSMDENGDGELGFMEFEPGG